MRLDPNSFLVERAATLTSDLALFLAPGPVLEVVVAYVEPGLEVEVRELEVGWVVDDVAPGLGSVLESEASKPSSRYVN